MGRLTVFSQDDCQECEFCREILNRWSIPFVEINVDHHPERRGDMIRLAKNVATPQIFFNSKHIVGGTSELQDILREWDEEAGSTYSTALQRFEYEVASLADPSDVRLFWNENVSSALAANRQGEWRAPKVLVNDELVSASRLTRQLQQYLPVDTIRKGRKVYENAFHGSDAIKVIMALFHFESKRETTTLVESCCQARIIHNLSSNDNSFREEDVYRLQPFQEPDIMNSFVLWTHQVSQHDATTTMLDLCKLMDKIVMLLGDGYDRKSVLKSDLYERFCERVCILQRVNLRETGLAFGLNLCNLMMRHYLLDHHEPDFWPQSKQEMRYLQSKIRYNIGGKTMKLSKLLDYVLDGVKDGYPESQKVWWQSLLPNAWQKPSADFRLHFCLSWATKSSPSVILYHEECLEEELAWMASNFCSRQISFAPEEGHIVVPKIFKWNKSDFGSNSTIVAQSLEGLLSADANKSSQLQETIHSKAQPLMIFYREYDWRPSFSPSRTRTKAKRRRDTAAVRLQELFYKPSRPAAKESTQSLEESFSYAPNSWRDDNSTFFHGDSKSTRITRDDLGILNRSTSYEMDGWTLATSMRRSNSDPSMMMSLFIDSRDDVIESKEKMKRATTEESSPDNDATNIVIPEHRNMRLDSEDDGPIWSSNNTRLRTTSDGTSAMLNSSEEGYATNGRRTHRIKAPDRQGSVESDDNVSTWFHKEKTDVVCTDEISSDTSQMDIWTVAPADDLTVAPLSPSSCTTHRRPSFGYEVQRVEQPQRESAKHPQRVSLQRKPSGGLDSIVRPSDRFVPHPVPYQSSKPNAVDLDDGSTLYGPPSQLTDFSSDEVSEFLSIVGHGVDVLDDDVTWATYQEL